MTDNILYPPKEKLALFTSADNKTRVENSFELYSLWLSKRRYSTLQVISYVVLIFNIIKQGAIKHCSGE